MTDREFLAEQFEAHRSHLRAVAYRMLGSLGEADDAVQDTWLRLSRADTSGVENMGGWLTTVVARVCLDMLRSRRSRREDPLDGQAPERVGTLGGTVDPEQEALLADSVGLALLVVLQTLGPAERLAFVLHDMFDVPFDEIGRIVGRSPTAARQLASRARRRVQGRAAMADADLGRQREVVDAFLAASRAGDFDRLLALLDPDVVLRVDRAVAASGAPVQLRGAVAVSRQAHSYRGGSRWSRAALIDGAVGVVVAPRGRLFAVLKMTVADGRIAEIDVVGDPERLRRLELGVLDT